MELTTILLFIVGLVLLVTGADILVKGASRLARVIGLSPLIIGLTVVAYGTSAPEVAVSTASVFNGQPDIAIGNVVGSNIANILLILGISALIAPLVVSRQLIILDVPIMIGLSLLVLLISLDGFIGFWDGFLFVGMLVAYTIFLVKKDQTITTEPETMEIELPDSRTFRHILFIVSGLALLILGSDWMVDGAVYIARLAGLSELIIGLTIVAVGTSLPEIATSILATIRGQRDIAVGNVIGSNIFNILGVLGISALFSGSGLPVANSLITFDLPIMLAVAVACMPIFLHGHLIDRFEGGLFLFYYIAYATYLVLQASSHDALPAFSATMIWFLLPVTVITIILIAWRAFHQGDFDRLRDM
ncbi:MAG: calcium/sodium antiporter [Bacteroidetes bacterium]|nr:calcium/sodium antiporter [Bacteroidota bacterium]